MGHKRMLWAGPLPNSCEKCGRGIANQFVHGKDMRSGRWMNMCMTCHGKHGQGLSAFRGVLYVADAARRFWTVADE